MNISSSPSLGKARSTYFRSTKILRESDWGPLLILLPILFASGWHFYTVLPRWFYCALAFILVFMMFISVYHNRTPIVEFNPMGLTWFGYWPWNKKQIAIEKIHSVQFVAEKNVLRLGWLLLVQLDYEVIKIWLPESQIYFSQREFSQLLSDHWGEKYIVSE